MFDAIERSYLERRAAIARERAEHCADPSVAEVHLQFAREYEARAAALGETSRSWMLRRTAD
jgi:hypothetical protein